MKNKDQVTNKDLDLVSANAAGSETKDPIQEQHQEGGQSMTEQPIKEATNEATEQVKEARILAERIKAQFSTPCFDDIPMIKSHGDNMLGQYNNAAAAALGVAVAAGLELISPTGTKTSAAIAAIAGGTAIALGAGAHTKMPQNAVTMGVSGLLGFKIAKGFGRLTVEYFPATKETAQVDGSGMTFVETLPAI